MCNRDLNSSVGLQEEVIHSEGLGKSYGGKGRWIVFQQTQKGTFFGEGGVLRSLDTGLRNCTANDPGKEKGARFVWEG